MKSLSLFLEVFIMLSFLLHEQESHVREMLQLQYWLKVLKLSQNLYYNPTLWITVDRKAFWHLCFLIFLMFISEGERESERKREEGAEEEGDRIQSRFHTLSCRYRAWRETRTHEPWDHDLNRSPNHPAAICICNRRTSAPHICRHTKISDCHPVVDKLMVLGLPPLFSYAPPLT